MLEQCPHCDSKVVFITDVCPQCQADRKTPVDVAARAKRREERARVELRARGPSYVPGCLFIIAAVITNFIGLSVTGSEVRYARSLPFFQSGQALNRAAAMEVSFKILILAFGLVGIILLIRTFVVRSRAQTHTKPDDKAA